MVCNLGQILEDYLPHQNIVINTKGVNIGTIIYLIARRDKEKNKIIFLVVQYLPLILASLGNYLSFLRSY